MTAKKLMELVIDLEAQAAELEALKAKGDAAASQPTSRSPISGAGVSAASSRSTTPPIDQSRFETPAPFRRTAASRDPDCEVGGCWAVSRCCADR